MKKNFYYYKYLLSKRSFYLGGNFDRSPSANWITVSGMIDPESEMSSSSTSSADLLPSSRSSSSSAESVSSLSRSYGKRNINYN